MKSMVSIEKLLKRKNNNYIKLARLFKKKTRADIVRGNCKKALLTKSCSIIIPFHNNYGFLKKNLTSLFHQDSFSEFKKIGTEIIIVSDGSPINFKKLIHRGKGSYPTTCLKLKRNYGRSTARNLGLFHAKNEIVVFLDEDIVVPKDFLITHLLRHEFSDKCVVVGFRQNISLKELDSRLDNSKRKIVKLPICNEDFRFKKFVSLDWQKTHKNLPASNFNKLYYPLKESGYFKYFGFGKNIGVWELPSMLLTSNASMPRNEIIKVGGFDFRFKGWGMEDVHLAAKLIANGLYLVPNLHSTVYHLVGSDYQKGMAKKMKEFEKNFKLYNKLKRQSMVLYKEDEWKEKMRKFFVNKYTSVRL